MKNQLHRAIEDIKQSNLHYQIVDGFRECLKTSTNPEKYVPKSTLLYNVLF